jgi:ribosome-associated protein
VTVSGSLPLGAFLKVAGAASTGGHAKLLVQEGEVLVNGEVETRRGRTLQPGDVVAVGGEEYRVCSSPA